MSSEPPRDAMIGMTSGVFFLTFFAALWGSAGASIVGPPDQSVLLVVDGVVTLGFLCAGLILLRRARSLRETPSSEDAGYLRAVRTLFAVVFATEIVLVVSAATLLPAFSLGRFVVPVVALIVGGHFIPLSRLFLVPVYFATGVALLALAIFAIVGLALRLPIGGPSPSGWSLVVAAGAMIVLWLTNLYLIRLSFGWLRGQS
jgi:hypothetical protein